MCDDHGAPIAPSLTRRGVLLGGLGAGAAALLGGRTASATPTRAAAAGLGRFRATNADGLTAYPIAMHVHDSFSEGSGNKAGQYTQAATNNFAGVWTTNHDWRIQGVCFTSAYSFAANETHFGKPWRFPRVTKDQGSLTSSSTGGVVAGPTSPNDPATGKGAFHLLAVSGAASKGTLSYLVDAKSDSRMNYAGNISGVTIAVDVYPVTSGAGGWLQLSIPLSTWPAINGLAAGKYSLLYRFRTDVTQYGYRTSGTTGIVDVPVAAGSYSTVTIDRIADIGRLWPAMPNPADNGTHTEIMLQATSSGGFRTEGYFAYLRFVRDRSLNRYAVEAAVASSYAASFPDLFIGTGTEISYWPHINRYGGTAAPFDYSGVTSLSQPKPRLIGQSIVSFIHASGGIASINHPFGTSDFGGAPMTVAAVAGGLIGNRAYGAELLEVGYQLRAGANTRQHMAVWDACSRNSLFLTGNGVSDDHSGELWATQTNRYYTALWSGALDEPSLQSALAAGRAYVGYLGSFGGALDCHLGTAPMGAVEVSPLSSRSYRVELSRLPAGAIAQVVRGVVDNAGTADPAPNTAVVATLTGTDLAAGSATVPIDTSVPCFVRTQVVNASTGAIHAFGNPNWSLKTIPAGGIPALRRRS